MVGSAVVCHGRAAGGIENEIGWKIDGRAGAIYDSLGGRFLENALGNYWWDSRGKNRGHHEQVSVMGYDFSA